MRRAIVAGAGGAAAVVAAGALAALSGGDAAPAAGQPAPGATATVERRDLVERDELEGTLGYADEGQLTAQVNGTITRLRAPGTVVRRGEALYSVDGRSAAWLLYGELPAWRDFGSGMDDGADVRQLERNLRALGHDPDEELTVDEEWDWATTDAVERFQDARGMQVDGTLSRGELVFRPGPARVGEVTASVGQPARPGLQIGTLSSTRREVVVNLDARRQQLARAGDAVTVDLPDGTRTRGRISEVGKVAERPAGEEDGDPTIEVTISLRGKAARGTGLDRAPVDVGLAVERREQVLAVPVKALLAREGGSFAVEVVEDGRRRLVPVDPGLHADDMVEVEGDLRAGQTVVTAR